MRVTTLVIATCHGSVEINGNFMQLLQWCVGYVPALKTWLKKPQDQFTSPAIHNKILEIMAMTVLRKISARIAGKHYAIVLMRTQIYPLSNNLCLPSFVDGSLNAHEYFIGFHSLDSTKAYSIVHTIEDILLRLSLQLEYCWGQYYDVAMVMTGHKSAVATTFY